MPCVQDGGGRLRDGFTVGGILGARPGEPAILDFIGNLAAQAGPDAILRPDFGAGAAQIALLVSRGGDRAALMITLSAVEAIIGAGTVRHVVPASLVESAVRTGAGAITNDAPAGSGWMRGAWRGPRGPASCI